MTLVDLEAIRSFWHWFETQHARLVIALSKRGSPDLTAATEELHAALGEVKPGLAFLLGPAKGDSGTREIFISADSSKELIPWVLALVEWAPTIPGIVVRGFRPRLNADTRIRFKDIELGVQDLYFQAFRLPDEKLGVTIYVPGLIEGNHSDLARVALLLLDHLLGEYDSLTAIDSLRVEPLPEDRTNLVPFELLVQFIDSRKVKSP